MKKQEICFVVLRSIALFLFYSAIVSLIKELIALSSAGIFTSWIVFLSTATSLVEGFLLWFIACPVSSAIFKDGSDQSGTTTDLADVILLLSFIWFAFFRLIKIVSTGIFLLRDDLLLPGQTIEILRRQQIVHLSVDFAALIGAVLIIRYRFQIIRWFMHSAKPLEER